MKIVDIRYFPGKNIYCYQPCIKGWVNLGDRTGIYTDELRGFSARLVAALPGLGSHHCSRGYPGGFIQRLQEGTLLGHVVEHLALELLTMAGLRVGFGKTRSTRQPEIYEVIVESPRREAGEIALRSACALVNQLLAGGREAVEPKIVEPQKGLEPESGVSAAVAEAVEQIRRSVERTALGPTTQAIVDAARRRRIPVIRLSDQSLVQLGYGKYLKRIQASITDLTSGIGVDIAGDKGLTKKLLAAAGIPVPPGGIAGGITDAAAIAARIGYPVVVKPLYGNQGRGVSVNVQSTEQLGAAAAHAQQQGGRLIVEKHLLGNQYRVLVIGGKFVAASRRITPFIIGDGLRTVSELVEQLNNHPWRGEGHEKPLTKIRVDRQVIDCLDGQGFGLESVPSCGCKVNLREITNLSTGGAAEDVTELVCPENRRLCERAARIIGLDVAGLDLVTKDIGTPLIPGEGGFLEVNAAPGLRMHLFPSQGSNRRVGDALINWMFPPDQPVRAPIVSVTGTNGKTTTVRMIASILRLGRETVGMTTSDGIYLGNDLIMSGDMTGPRSAQILLRDPAVGIAVLETARGGILRAGIGYENSDVAVITNITGDHLGQDGIETLEELADAKALVGELVPPSGWVVLNADDPLSVKQLDRFSGSLMFFTRTWNLPVVRRHLGAGGSAVFVKSGEIILAKGSQAFPIMKVREIPATYDGMAEHNVENALAAIAAAAALKVDPKVIAKALRNFNCDLQQNPGRLNIIPAGEIRIVLDYGHNPQGFSKIMETLRRIHPGPLTAVAGMPGDRRDADLIGAGKVLGRSVRKLIIKEDADRRGRSPGEAAALIQAGALAAGLHKEQITLIMAETKAVTQALREAAPGEMVVIFYEKLAAILPILETELKYRNIKTDVQALNGQILAQ